MRYHNDYKFMVKVLGHRGCAGIEPENTMRAFKRAMDLGVDFIELDVRKSRDKKLVVIHDDKVDRTTNDNGYVRDLTFEDLKHKFIDEEVVVECHENDIGVNAWVVNEIEDIERMKELGVDIISSDYPDRV